MHRLAQAAKSLAAWKEFLRAPRASLKKRLKLLFSTVFASALWMSETWLPTKQQREHLLSWGARMASSVAGYSSSFATLSAAQFWRALHRRGHALLAKMGNTLDESSIVEATLFCWTFGEDHPFRICHCCSEHVVCLGGAENKARYRSKFDGLHPKRFKCWRWESQITAFCGEPHLPDDGTEMLVGWPWRTDKTLFGKRTWGISLQTLIA